MNTSQSDTTPTLESFDDLLAMARAEPDPCRLLTVLVQAEIAYRRRPDGSEALVDEGLLRPVMVRDWAVTDSLCLADIVTGADEVTHEWRFLMTAILPGTRGRAPTPGECEPHLERMATALAIGEDLDAFVFFDREGVPARVTNASS
ncbi:hypothetical protein [Salinisphaera hydrothermalis]|uniref:hypothetical protein n=1 Tax=Salinisphaera hydrothermalis TaxID=563188 RepID=UPI00333F3DAB